MDRHHRDTRKIDPTRGTTLGDGSANDQDRMEIGPTQLAMREWEAAGLTLPNLADMRSYRHRRLALLPNVGPPEAGFSRPFHDDGLVTPSG